MRALFLALTLISFQASAKPSARVFQIYESLDTIWENGARLKRGFDEPRTRLLVRLAAEVRDNPIEILDPDSKAEIHEKAQRLFRIFPNKGASQNALIAFFSRLDLWNESDFSILANLAGHERATFTVRTAYPLVLQYLSSASLEQRGELASGLTSVMHQKDLGNLLLLYKINELPPHKLTSLLQYMAEESMTGAFQSMAEDTLPFADFPPTAAIARQKIFRENIYDLLQYAASDLHARFSNGDEAVLRAVSEVKRRQEWKRGSLSQEERDKVLQFVQEIEQGTCRWELDRLPK